MQSEIGAIEVVIFSTKSGYTQAEAQTALETLNDCVAQFDGFIERKLAVDEKGRWIDIVYWQSKGQALTAAEEIMKDPRALQVFDIIEEEQMQMFHFNHLNTFTNDPITQTK